MSTVLTSELPAGQTIELPSNNLLTVNIRTASMPAGSSGVVQCIRFAVGTSPIADSATAIPANAVVLSTVVDIRTAYDPGTTIRVGRVGALDLLQLDTDNYPPLAGTYPKVSDIDWGPAAPIRASIGGGPSVGNGWVVVQYSLPDP